MNESEIQQFWQRNSCTDLNVGGLEKYHNDYETFFREYDKFRYSKESHIIRCLDGIEFNGKKTLEIGLGRGADSEQIIRRGAIWSGIDFTDEAVGCVGVRLKVKNLPFGELRQGSVLDMPFDNNCFDIIFSHGVLHHVPDIGRAQKEIYRVLKPGGELIVMLYAKWSLNYLLSISILRRLGLSALYFMKLCPDGIYGQHIANARAMGLKDYLRMSNFLHKNTDGPENPYSKLYDLRAVKSDFTNFRSCSCLQTAYACSSASYWLASI